MSGHSKWANIKHRKARVDAKRGKIFTKLGRELIMAARESGGDPETNFKLKTLIQKAKAANMPQDNISRAIKRGSGETGGVDFEEIVYEGYAPGGVAVLLSILTDNRNRTAGEIRHLFSKQSGSLGETGCVAWMFEQRGVITLSLAEVGMDEDEIMMIGLEAGAEDVTVVEDDVEIVTVPGDLNAVRARLETQGLKLISSEVLMAPKTTVALTDPEQAQQVLRLAEALEDHDDVQAVYANFELPDSVLAQIEV